jgi:hypothetical protein
MSRHVEGHKPGRMSRHVEGYKPGRMGRHVEGYKPGRMGRHVKAQFLVLGAWFLNSMPKPVVARVEWAVFE